MDSGWDKGSDPAIAELMEVLASLEGSVFSESRAFFVYQYPWGSWTGERAGVVEIPIGLPETIGVLRRAASDRDF